MGKTDWDVVTNYSDVVTTTLKTVTFPKVQEQVYLRNQGNANFTYTIGSQSGTLTPGQSVTVNQDVSSFTLQAVSGTHTFELRAKEKGTEIEEAPSDVPSQIASLTSSLAESVHQLNDFKYTYTYLDDGSVQTITEKDKDSNVISTTTFTYLTSGDVDTSIKVMDGQTVTTQYIYDVNGNLTDTVNTKA
jgi:hypothetical protein